MLAYSTSVQEFAGYTPHFLVYGQEIRFLIDSMYPSPTDHSPAKAHDYVLDEQMSFKTALDAACAARNFKQRRRNPLQQKSPWTRLTSRLKVFTAPLC